MFEEFWKIYPKKVDKAEAKKLFEKLPLEVRQIIIIDVVKRILVHSQWREKEFVPSPARYLRKKLWNDEYSTRKTVEQKQADNEDGTILSRFWTMLMQMYGSKFVNSFGETMPVAWRSGLRDLTERQASQILKLLTEDQKGFMPDLATICRLRKFCHAPIANKMLPSPTPDPAIIDDAFNQLKGILKY